ncbi:MAG TPA: PAS domain S-box protein [Streptosporangiaceae bacterium]|jgi:anti-anti-sigma factor
MSEDSYPEQWTGRRAVVTLPGQIDLSNAGQIGDQLLSAIDRGAIELIADMTGTVSCDHAGADALMRAYQRAAVRGTQLRLVVTAEIVRRTVSLNGLDRVIPVYRSLEAATAAAEPATVIPFTAADGGHTAPPGSAPPRPEQRAAGAPDRPRSAVITGAVLGRLIDALADGVALAGDDGTLALVNRRAEEMFGYEHGELAGQLVEALIPADLRAAHAAHRAGYTRAPRTRAMGEGMRLVGLRKDGTTFPLQVSLSPVPTATGHLTLAVIRDATNVRQGGDLMDIARAAVAARQAYGRQEVLDRIVDSLFDVGLSLQAAIDLPSDLARQHIAQALQQLDDAIREIRDYAFTTRGYEVPPDPTPSDGDQ